MTLTSKEIHHKLTHDKDFKAKILQSQLMRIKFVKDFEECLGIQPIVDGRKQIGNFQFTRGLTEEQSCRFNKEYRQFFAAKGKDVDLTDPYQCSKFLAARYRTLFGRDIVNNPERETTYEKGTSRKQTYVFNEDRYKEHEDMYIVRNRNTEYCSILDREIKFTRNFQGDIVYTKDVIDERAKKLQEKEELEKQKKRNELENSDFVTKYGATIKETET